MKLLSFGEVLWDVYPQERFIGGAPLNFAAHCAKHGIDAFMLSAVGDDELGRQTLQQLKNWGLRTDYVSVLPHKQTGKCIVTLDEHSVPSYHLLEDVAWDEIPLPAAAASSADVLYFGTLALRSQYNLSSLQALIKERSFRHIFVDVNIRPPFYSRESIHFALENATIAKISDEELPVVANALEMVCTDDHAQNARQLAARFPQLKLVLITLGKDGSCAFDVAADAFYRQGPVKTEVVSTVGAGDSFGAAFLSRYAQGAPIDQCLAHAAKIAAFVVSRFDAIPDYEP